MNVHTKLRQSFEKQPFLVKSPCKSALIWDLRVETGSYLTANTTKLFKDLAIYECANQPRFTPRFTGLCSFRASATAASASCIGGRDGSSEAPLEGDRRRAISPLGRC